MAPDRPLRSLGALALATLAFTVCFAAWTLNSVLVTYLAESGRVPLDRAQVGWLLGLPILTGSILRIPIGLATDRLGGRVVFPAVMLAAAGGGLWLSVADGFAALAAASLVLGLAGTGFAVGIGYSSLWFPRERQGVALGIFGAGNAGAGLTSLLGPTLLERLAGGGGEGWRAFPRVYALALVVMAVGFALLAPGRTAGVAGSLRGQLAPLRSLRVWRFGFYYFLVFGGFVALAQWLIPYYVNVYGTTLVAAGLLATVFNLPSGLIRAAGGWVSDRFGARATTWWVFVGCGVCCALLVFPPMDVRTPGGGVMATAAGRVTDLQPGRVVVDRTAYALRARPAVSARDEAALLLPVSEMWHEPVVAPGDAVTKRQLLARGVTHVRFQANIGVFTALVFVVGILMGVGKASVYKYIPEYFPGEVGAVGGLVGAIGGLGGFVCPILFGYLLQSTGVWTTCWMFLAALSFGCLLWLHRVVQRMQAEAAPDLRHRIEGRVGPGQALVERDVTCPVHGVRARIAVSSSTGRPDQAVACQLFAADGLACGACHAERPA